jgi:hypothetical protein
MTRTTLILPAGFLCCLVICGRVHPQEPVSRNEAQAGEVRAQLVEGEINVAVHELELKMSELAVEEEKVEAEKIELQLEAAQQLGNGREVAHIRLELKQAGIRVEMRKVQSQMARLQLKLAKVGLDNTRAALTDKGAKPTRVQVEYLDDLGVIILRGAQSDVERIRALFEAAEGEKKDIEKK